MLSAQEVLMMQAAYDEQDRLQAQNTAGLLGAAGGGLMGAAAGTIPHSIGNAINALRGFNVDPGEYCASKALSNNGLEIVSFARAL